MAISRAEFLFLVQDRPVAFHRFYARVAGGALPGLFLAQAVYWTGRGTQGTPETPNEDGWFYKSQAAWLDELGMTRYEQESARKRLRDAGVLEERHAGMPAKLYFRVNYDVLIPLVQAAAVAEKGAAKDGEKPHPRKRDSRKQGRGAATPLDGENQHPSLGPGSNQGSARAPSMNGAIPQRSESTPESSPENTRNMGASPDQITELFREFGRSPGPHFLDRTDAARRWGRQNPRALVEILGRLRFLPAEQRDEVRFANALDAEVHRRRTGR
jgi:hypothetical protein